MTRTLNCAPYNITGVISARLAALLAAMLLLATLTGCTKIEDTLFKAAMHAEQGMAGLDAATLAVDDINWSYLHNNWKDGQDVVVLLHGFSADKSNWPRFVAKFGDGYNIIAPDLPGHGETSQGMDLAYDVDTQARRVLSLMDALGVDKFHVAGNSMGGAIAVRIAWLAPARVSSVGLFNAAGAKMVDSDFDKELKEGRNPLIVNKPEDFRTVMSWAMAKPPFIPWPVPQVMGRKGVARAALNEKIFADLRRDNGIDQTAILPEVSARTLVLWGDQDRLLNVANADLFVSSMPQAKKVIMPGIGHAPMLEAPAESAAIYRDFLAGH